MNIAHTRIGAAAGAQFCGYSLVRRLATGMLISLAVMTAATAAPGNRDRYEYRAPQGQTRQDDAQRQYSERERERQFDQREFQARADENRRNLQMQQEQNNAEAFRRSGRLTPDERRDLRRQINEAGNDIYPNRRRR